MESFLDELVKLGKIEDLKKKNKGFKNPTICQNCGKLFDDPRKHTVNPRKSCSEKCRRELLSKRTSGVRAPNRVKPSYYKKQIINLEQLDKEEKKKTPEHKTIEEESLDSFLFMDP